MFQTIFPKHVKLVCKMLIKILHYIYQLINQLIWDKFGFSSLDRKKFLILLENFFLLLRWLIWLFTFLESSNFSFLGERIEFVYDVFQQTLTKVISSINMKWIFSFLSQVRPFNSFFIQSHWKFCSKSVFISFIDEIFFDGIYLGRMHSCINLIAISSLYIPQCILLMKIYSHSVGTVYFCCDNNILLLTLLVLITIFLIAWIWSTQEFLTDSAYFSLIP